MYLYVFTVIINFGLPTRQIAIYKCVQSVRTIIAPRVKCQRCRLDFITGLYGPCDPFSWFKRKVISFKHSNCIQFQIRVSNAFNLPAIQLLVLFWSMMQINPKVIFIMNITFILTIVWMKRCMRWAKWRSIDVCFESRVTKD